MHDSEKRICQNCKAEFVIDAPDFKFYEKMAVPPPTWCPKCRSQRRFIFWNGHHLFLANDALTGKKIFSAYPKNAGLKLYENEYWWSDGWDPLTYGKAYDFSRPFLTQFRELFYVVPWSSRQIWNLNASEYSNNASRLKNCYLCFDCDQSENCAYATGFRHCRDSFELDQCNYLELCYELVSSDHNYKTFFSFDCDNCRNVWFSYQCRNCSNCFGCVNLKNKQYHIFNKPYEREEYEKKIKTFKTGSYNGLTKIKEEMTTFRMQLPRKYMHTEHAESVSGDFIYHAKNVKYSYQCDKDIRDLKYCQRIVNGVSDAYDYSCWGDNSELIYESLLCGENCRNVRFCFNCWPACEDLQYSASCHSSRNLFGCVGLKNKQYCILNRQYSKKDYEALVPKIIAHMNKMPYVDEAGRVYRYGEFFPPEFSPFAYNETLAQEYFPLSSESARASGFLWRESEKREYKITMKAADIPDHINDIEDSILGEVIECMHQEKCNEGCTKAFRIIPQELKFLRREELPLPRLCSNCRHYERARARNPHLLWRRGCQCQGNQSSNGAYKNFASHYHGADFCPSEFETTFSPERTEIIYCESCYNSEIA